MADSISNSSDLENEKPKRPIANMDKKLTAPKLLFLFLMAIIIFTVPIRIAAWYIPYDQRELAVYPNEVIEHQMEIVNEIFQAK